MIVRSLVRSRVCVRLFYNDVIEVLVYIWDVFSLQLPTNLPLTHLSQRAAYSSALHCVRRRLPGEVKGWPFFNFFFNLRFVFLH